MKIEKLGRVVELGPFPCPFCEGQFSVTENPPTVMHTRPACAKYTALEPTDYLRKARLSRTP